MTHTYKREPCLICGELIAENWMIRHMRERHPDETDRERKTRLERRREGQAVAYEQACRFRDTHAYLHLNIEPTLDIDRQIQVWFAITVADAEKLLPLIDRILAGGW